MCKHTRMNSYANLRAYKSDTLCVLGTSWISLVSTLSFHLSTLGFLAVPLTWQAHLLLKVCALALPSPWSITNKFLGHSFTLFRSLLKCHLSFWETVPWPSYQKQSSLRHVPCPPPSIIWELHLVSGVLSTQNNAWHIVIAPPKNYQNESMTIFHHISERRFIFFCQPDTQASSLMFWLLKKILSVLCERGDQENGPF